MVFKKILEHRHVKKVITHRHFVKYEKYVSLFLWLGVIFYLSSKSLNVFVTTDVWAFILRKLAHMFEFAVLTYLIFRILGETEKRHVNWNLFWSLVFSILYAVSDEYHQSFVLGRVGTYKDVLIDSSGSLIAVWLCYLHCRHKKIKKIIH